MTRTVRFRLRITAYSPDSMPMARLAEYMGELAALMGCESGVHFKGATKGSTVLNVDVEAERVSHVEQRLRLVGNAGASLDAQRAMTRLEALMRADGARGTLSREGGERLVRFLGIDAAATERIGPIRESTTLDGELVRVGGKDRTIHALVLGADGQEFKLSTTSRDTARQLASHLFTRIRATGMGTWFRSEGGVWELEDLRLEGFEPLADRSLVEAVAELRAIEGSGWHDEVNPLAEAHRLRKH